MNVHVAGTVATAPDLLTDQERMIRDTARQLARDVIAPGAAERDRTAAWPHAELRAIAGQGFMGMLLPEEHGGADSGFLAYCLSVEEFAGADAGLSTIFHVHNIGGGLPIATAGSDEQKRRWLPPLARGERIGTFLLTEPQAGSDTAALRTTARRDGDEYVLSGTKQFVSNGSEAGMALVMAVTDKEAGKRGITTFIVDPSASGYRIARIEEKHGQRCAHTAQVALEEVRVPVSDVLGEVGGGYRVAMATLSEGRVAVAAQAVGIAQAALEAAIRYAGERQAYGGPIANLQGVSFRLAEMAMQVDVARQYYIHAARLREARLPFIREAAIAKLFASEMAERVCSDALQIHGGYGYLRDFPVERFARDVRACKLYEGTSDIQRLIIARNL